MRRSYVYYIVACAIAALLPFVSARFETPATGAAVVGFPGWPNTFEGKTLTPLPLNEMEKRFATEFPGRIARFSDGAGKVVEKCPLLLTGLYHLLYLVDRPIGYLSGFVAARLAHLLRQRSHPRLSLRSSNVVYVAIGSKDALINVVVAVGRDGIDVSILVRPKGGVEDVAIGVGPE